MQPDAGAAGPCAPAQGYTRDFFMTTEEVIGHGFYENALLQNKNQQGQFARECHTMVGAGLRTDAGRRHGNRRPPAM